MIDGVLQLDFPASATNGSAGGASHAFVVGAENRLLAPPLERLLNAAEFAAAASQFNPLVLVGPSGSGKSHLAQGLVRVWSQRFGASEVAYFTAADFGRERQAAEAEERLEAWRQQTRAARLLVVEDVDRLRPRATIQQELRASIDAIVAAGGAVVITAMREPIAISHLEPGLRDRLTAGLTVRLNRPEPTTRRAILATAAAARGLALDAPQLDHLAHKDCATVASLLSRLSGPLPREGRAREGGEAATSTSSTQPTIKQILAVTARYFSLTQAALTGHSRRTNLVQARNVVVHLARQLTDLSYAEIGRALGGRDHTTIMHADRRLADRLATDPATQQAVDELDRIVRS